VSATAPDDVVVDEAVRLLDLAGRSGVALRAMGGVAVRLRLPPEASERFRRPLNDIDFATSKAHGRRVESLLTSTGYAANENFNALHGARRLMFFDAQDRKIDVFVDWFQMCHELPIGERLECEPVTLPLAELLLTKLQIVKLDHKDFADMYALLLTHDVGDDDGDTINAARVAFLCARDWGLCRTSTLNLDRLVEESAGFDLAAEDRAAVAAKVGQIRSAIEAEPKSGKWKLRARLGDRVRWYEEPDEV
jgi:Uncharacterised nucleotidyltransferase